MSETLIVKNTFRTSLMFKIDDIINNLNNLTRKEVLQRLIKVKKFIWENGNI